MKTTKILSIISVILMSGCAESGQTDNNDGQTDIPKGKLTISADKTAICADGNDAATFTVTFMEGSEAKDVTDKAEIYFTESDKLLGSDRFSTTSKGEYTFYAAYGLNVSDEVTVSAISVIPEIPSDPEKDGTSFHHRMLLIQHTGATCPNCPKMMTSLKTLSEDEEYNSSYCLVASHAYYDGLNDAAYSSAAKTVSSLFNSGAYPELTFNLTNKNTGYDYKEICREIDSHRKEAVHAGIAAAAEAADGEVVVNAEFKFSKDGTYRIGAWLLEDGIFATQHGAVENWQHTHNNALRAMYGSRQTECVYGISLGEVKAGNKKDMLFRLSLEEGWESENCKVMVFITEKDASGDVYDIVNCTVCKVGESASYEYR